MWWQHKEGSLNMTTRLFNLIGRKDYAFIICKFDKVARQNLALC
jgi:hypothetical protein